MREREPAPQDHVDDRSERHGRHVERPEAALQLASQMGNVAFRTLARTVARQPADEHIEFPPDYIVPESGGQGDSEYIEFPPDYVGPQSGGQGDSEYIEFPPDYIGPGN
jgi:hypothetical protein